MGKPKLGRLQRCIRGKPFGVPGTGLGEGTLSGNSKKKEKRAGGMPDVHPSKKKGVIACGTYLGTAHVKGTAHLLGEVGLIFSALPVTLMLCLKL